MCAKVTLTLLLQSSKSNEPNCEACDPSCLDCRGPSRWNCTVCPALQILSDDGRCLSCCGNETRHDDKPIPWECCDCIASRGKQEPTLEHRPPAEHREITEASCAILSIQILVLDTLILYLDLFLENSVYLRVSHQSHSFRASFICNGCPV